MNERRVSGLENRHLILYTILCFRSSKFSFFYI
jgi:hypothetical protein